MIIQFSIWKVEDFKYPLILDVLLIMLDILNMVLTP